MARRGAGEGSIFERPDAEELCADGALSIAEAASFLGLSRAELYRMMERGRLVYVQHGRRRLSRVGALAPRAGDPRRTAPAPGGGPLPPMSREAPCGSPRSEIDQLIYLGRGNRRACARQVIPRRAAVRLLAAGLSGGQSNGRANA
jgi:excisionase family DNA binding protein